MSDGATISAPARACDSASAASSSSVGSFATSPFSITPQCPWLGVFAQANVGNHHQLQLRPSNRLDRALHHPGRRRKPPTALILVLRNAEQNHRRNAQRFHFPALLDNLVRRLLVHARHRADLFAHAAARAHKHRVHEAPRREPRLAHHAANRFACGAAAAGAGPESIRDLPFRRALQRQNVVPAPHQRSTGVASGASTHRRCARLANCRRGHRTHRRQRHAASPICAKRFAPDRARKMLAHADGLKKITASTSPVQILSSTARDRATPAPPCDMPPLPSPSAPAARNAAGKLGVRAVAARQQHPCPRTSARSSAPAPRH